MRDTQKSRVYSAERSVPHGRRLETVPEIQAFLDGIIKQKWFIQRYGEKHPISISDGRGTRIARGGGWHVNLPGWSRSELIILHEFAHNLQPSWSAWHGREFCKIFLELVSFVMGRVAYSLLKAAYQEKRVKWTLPDSYRVKMAERFRWSDPRNVQIYPSYTAEGARIRKETMIIKNPESGTNKVEF